MEETFEITVPHKGKDLLFPVKIIRYGYVHRIQIEINGSIVFLEKDEEGHYRAIATDMDAISKAKDLIETVTTYMEKMLG